MFRSIFVVIAETLCISIHTFGQGQVLETEKNNLCSPFESKIQLLW